jgi:hypothetical protein
LNARGWHPTCISFVREEENGTQATGQTMLETALLISSALSLALVMVFSELP